MMDMQQLKKGMLMLVMMLVLASAAFYLIDKRQESFIQPVKNGTEMPLYELLLDEDIKDHQLILVNFFASWCEGCQMEHEKLLTLSKEKDIYIIGIAFQDTEERVSAFLKEKGNPYHKIIYDKDGHHAINWGIYGVPESYVLNAKATLLYRHQGVLFSHHVKDSILPLLKNEAQG